MKENQAKKFCRCIKSVKKTVKVRRGSTTEGAAIAICTKSMLQRKGRTLKRIKCAKPNGPKLNTQKLK
uniref:Uncharacterized protein n=1 Tax=viral metagenome TaxID=1070528 RepID=A0A6C0K8T4_9ZZZZ